MVEFWDIVDEYGHKTGKILEKGKPMQKGDYHLSVTVWIQNHKGEFLISKRTPNEHTPNMWEPTSGSAIAGEDGLTAALRETKEELGISLQPENGRRVLCYTYPHGNGDGAAYIEVWIFYQEVDLSAVTLQPDETCDVKWVDVEHIRQMIEAGNFTNFSYLAEPFPTEGLL